MAEFGQDGQVLRLLPGLVPGIDNFLQGGAFLQKGLGLFLIIPEGGAGYFRLEFGDAFFLGGYVKETSVIRRDGS